MCYVSLSAFVLVLHVVNPIAHILIIRVQFLFFRMTLMHVKYQHGFQLCGANFWVLYYPFVKFLVLNCGVLYTEDCYSNAWIMNDSQLNLHTKYLKSCASLFHHLWQIYIFQWHVVTLRRACKNGVSWLRAKWGVLFLDYFRHVYFVLILTSCKVLFFPFLYLFEQLTDIVGVKC